MISAADILAARLLVVDDDIDALRSLKQMLTTAGYNSVHGQVEEVLEKL